MLTPFQTGALHVALAAISEVDELMCKVDTCEKSAAEEDCVVLWQDKKLPEGDACPPCQEHITIQRVVKMLESLKRKK